MQAVIQSVTRSVSRFYPEMVTFITCIFVQNKKRMSISNTLNVIYARIFALKFIWLFKYLPMFSQVDAVRNLAKQCGLESTGSKMDLVIRLKEQMKSRSAFDKVFQKVWGASGKLINTQKYKSEIFVDNYIYLIKHIFNTIKVKHYFNTFSISYFFLSLFRVKVAGQ